MKFLITGGAGFIGSRLAEHIVSKRHEVYAHDINWNRDKKILPGIQCITGDLIDSQTLNKTISGLNIDGVFHLAAQASVQLSWKNPVFTYNINVLGTAALIEVLKSMPRPPKLVFISSGEVYGVSGNSDAILSENMQSNPCNPYGLSKVFGEEICRKFYSSYCIARPFSVTGVGQTEFFAIPNFCHQIARMKNNEIEPVLHVGNIKIARNFISVESLVEAYWIIFKKGRQGEIYNVAARDSILMQDVLHMLKHISGIDFKIQVDSERVRPSEPGLAGIDISKICRLGWEPQASLEETLKKMYEYYLGNKSVPQKTCGQIHI